MTAVPEVTDVNLLELALFEHWSAPSDEPLRYVRNADGYTAVYDMADWFNCDITSAIELRALSFALPGKRVLDVGAGVGRHALALLQRGVRDVVALDVMPRAVDIMRQRGIAHAHCVDVLAAELYGSDGRLARPPTGRGGGHDAILQHVVDTGDQLFDVVLLLSDTIGFVGTVDGACDLLRKLQFWVAPGGHVLLDCSDIEVELRANPAQHAEFLAQQPAGAYVGQSLMHLEYRGQRGASFNWLYLSFEKLRAIAADCGWRCFLLQRTGIEYLVELRRDSEERSSET